MKREKKSKKNDIIDKLTLLLIRQDFKDKRIGKIECISKVAAYRSLIDIVKEFYND